MWIVYQISFGGNWLTADPKHPEGVLLYCHWNAIEASMFLEKMLGEPVPVGNITMRSTTRLGTFAVQFTEN